MQHRIFMTLYSEVEPYIAGYSTVYFVANLYGSKQQLFFGRKK